MGGGQCFRGGRYGSPAQPMRPCAAARCSARRSAGLQVLPAAAAACSRVPLKGQCFPHLVWQFPAVFHSLVGRGSDWPPGQGGIGMYVCVQEVKGWVGGDHVCTTGILSTTASSPQPTHAAELSQPQLSCTHSCHRGNQFSLCRSPACRHHKEQPAFASKGTSHHLPTYLYLLFSPFTPRHVIPLQCWK